MDGLTIKYDPTMDKAVEIAKENIRMCMGHNPCDCRGVTPNPPGRFYRGVWVQDSLWTYCDALLYWPDIDEEELRDYLYSEVPGHMGVIPFFTRAQERSGRYRGNVPTARWEKGTPTLASTIWEEGGTWGDISTLPTARGGIFGTSSRRGRSLSTPCISIGSSSTMRSR